MGPRSRLVLLSLFVLLAWTSLTSAMGRGCVLCMPKVPTLVSDHNQALMVLVGTLTNPRAAEGTTDFVIDKVLKSHAFDKVKMVDGKMVITLPRYVPQAKNPYLIFCDIYKGSVDPYRGVELIGKSELVPYLIAALALKDKSPGERLRYYFDHLNSAELDVARDAYQEFVRADYKDYMEMAKKLPPDTIAKWLLDPKTPPDRCGLYGRLLGHCGKAEHAQTIRKLIDDSEKRCKLRLGDSGIDGLLAGYVMIQPKEAWAYITNLLKDDSREFLMRYAGVLTIRFLWDQRPDLIAKKDLVAGLALLLNQGDMADFAIEDLRKWQRWEMTDRVLDLFGKKSHDVRVVKRAIVRFALRCPLPRATAFVQAQRQRDADWVNEIEELLKLEYPDPPAKTK